MGEERPLVGCDVVVGVGCVPAGPEPEGLAARFAGHTMLTFGAVID